jgi:hypothetical protein
MALNREKFRPIVPYPPPIAGTLKTESCARDDTAATRLQTTLGYLNFGTGHGNIRPDKGITKHGKFHILKWAHPAGRYGFLADEKEPGMKIDWLTCLIASV